MKSLHEINQDRERQIPYDLTCMQNLKKKGGGAKLILDAENRDRWLPESCNGTVGKMGEGGQKLQAASYKTSKSWDLINSYCIFEYCQESRS